MQRPLPPIVPDSASTAEALCRFVPPVLYRWPGFEDSLEHRVATLFIDVAGFTALSEHLAARGPEGAELLEQAIAAYFDALVDQAEVYGGFPIKVAGDSLAVIFPSRDEPFQVTVRRALCCAARLRWTGDSPKVGTAGDLRLAHKIGVGAGRLLAGYVGDPALRAEYVFAGEALDRAVAAEHRARAGEVWVSPDVVSIIEMPQDQRHNPPLWAARDAGGFGRLSDGDVGHSRRLSDGSNRTPLFQPAHVVARFSALIPAAVQEHAAQGTLSYLSRHQNLTVMFAGCPEMRFDGPEALAQLDAHYRQVQQIVAAHGGFLSEFEAGDKGAKLVVLFGAPTTLEDPCGAAARCAQAMQRAARSAGLVRDQRIGLTTGRLYTGRVGCRSLVRFGALGDRMNLAARLMANAAPWSVLAERYTAIHSAGAARWSSPQLLQVKGKTERTGVCSLEQDDRHREDRRGAGLLGRTCERRLCDARIDALHRLGRGAILRLHGPAGIGKTRLIEAIRRGARACSIRTVNRTVGAAVPSGPLSAWRPLLLDLLGTHDRASRSELERCFAIWMASLPQDLRRAAGILAPLVGIEYPVDPLIARLPAERQLAIRQQSLIECIVHAIRRSPRVLVLDDAHHIDGPSLQLLIELLPQLEATPLLVVVAHRSAPAGSPDMQPAAGDRHEPRPAPGKGAGPLEKLATRPGVESIELRPLGPREAARLACRHLQVQRLDSELEALLTARARGIPLLIEAWIDFLRHRGHLHQHNGVAWLAGDRVQALPDRLEALILTQLESLPSPARLTMSVASIIGPSMVPSDVAALHPEGESEAVVAAHLRLGAQAGLLHYDRGNTPWMYFSRPEVQEAIHESLPFHLRRSLHTRRARQILAAVQGEPQDDLVLVLARHHEYVDDSVAQRRYFLRATTVCEAAYDHQGTVRWARRLAELCETHGDSAGFLHVAYMWKHALELLGERQACDEVSRRWIRCADETRDLKSLVDAVRTHARTQFLNGEATEATACLDRTIEVARSLEDPSLLTDTLINACSIYGEAGRNELMVETTEEALRCVPPGDSRRLIKILCNRGFAYEQLARPEAAYQDYERALGLALELGDVWRQSILIGNIAVVLWAMGRPEEGHSRLLKALELKRQVGDRREVALGLLNVGFSFFRLADLQQARSFTEEALQLCQRLGYARAELIATSNLGEILRLSDTPDAAAGCFARAEALLTTLPNRNIQTELRLRRGELALDQGNLTVAAALFQQTLDAPGAVPTEAGCNALEGLATVRLEQGAITDASALIGMVLERLEAGQVQLAFPQRTWWRAARIAAADGDGALSAARLKQAVRLLEQEQRLLSSRSARNRLARAFPWTRALSGMNRTTSIRDTGPLPVFPAASSQELATSPGIAPSAAPAFASAATQKTPPFNGAPTGELPAYRRTSSSEVRVNASESSSEAGSGRDQVSPDAAPTQNDTCPDGEPTQKLAAFTGATPVALKPGCDGAG